MSRTSPPTKNSRRNRHHVRIRRREVLLQRPLTGPQEIGAQFFRFLPGHLRKSYGYCTAGKTMRPATTVRRTRVLVNCAGGTLVRSFERRTKSAYSPGFSSPFLPSSNCAYAEPEVYARMQSSSEIFSCGSQPFLGPPSGRSRVTQAYNPRKGLMGSTL